MLYSPPVSDKEPPTRPQPVQETFVAKWGRRLVTVPSYTLLAVVLVSTAPLWGTCLLALDVLSGNILRCPRLRAGALVAVYFVFEAVGVAVATWIWLVTAGARLGGHARFLAMNEALQRWWTSAFFRSGQIVCGARLVVEGAELVDKGPLLFLVRHTSVSDAVLTAAVVTNPRGLNLRYVLKRQLTWDPCLDIVGRRLPNAFVERRARRARADLNAIAQLTEGLNASSAVLIYPEGTRYTSQKRTRAVEALRQRGDQRLIAIAETFRHVLPPRLGGSLALLRAASGVDTIVVDHVGLDNATTLRDLWRGSLIGATIRVRLRRYPSSGIPEADRDVWLFERWREMDEWVDQWVRQP